MNQPQLAPPTLNPYWDFQKLGKTHGNHGQATHEEVCVYESTGWDFDSAYMSIYLCVEATTWGWKERHAAFFVRKSLRPFSFQPVSRGWRISLIGLKQENCSVPFSVQSIKSHFKCNKSLYYTSDWPLLLSRKIVHQWWQVWLAFKCDAEMEGKDWRAEKQTSVWYFGISLVLSIIWCWSRFHSAASLCWNCWKVGDWL